VGNITGAANININSMHVSRLKPRGQALMILALDEALPDKVLNRSGPSPASPMPNW